MLNSRLIWKQIHFFYGNAADFYMYNAQLICRRNIYNWRTARGLFCI